MRLRLDPDLRQLIERHAEQAYPEEGAGFLLGKAGEERRITGLIPLSNAGAGVSRATRYLITPEDYIRAEAMAQDRGAEVIGVFHSHPDHPNRPSEYDREWAQPYFSYLITSVVAGRASESKCWRLKEDRSGFDEEYLVVS